MVKRILIVDDSKTARNMIRRSLEICGLDDAEISEAQNGREALEILHTVEYDLVFTDLNMPEMDGEQLLKRMKSSPKLNEIPIVVISSLANPQKESELLKDNASKVLSKPLSLTELQALFEDFLEDK